MKGEILIVLLGIASVYGVTIIDRDGWGARPPKSVTPMSNPVPYVIIHHSYIPGACSSQSACISAMKSMQNSHMDANGWDDIGYSFGAGGDGNAYEGRGWSVVGAHAPNYNSMSIGICLIGDFTSSLPPKKQLDAVKELIDYGVSKGYISSNYVLYGHRQVKDTDCPGDALFNEIRTWPHFEETYDEFHDV